MAPPQAPRIRPRGVFFAPARPPRPPAPPARPLAPVTIPRMIPGCPAMAELSGRTPDSVRAVGFAAVPWPRAGLSRPRGAPFGGSPIPTPQLTLSGPPRPHFPHCPHFTPHPLQFVAIPPHFAPFRPLLVSPLSGCPPLSRQCPGVVLACPRERHPPPIPLLYSPEYMGVFSQVLSSFPPTISLPLLSHFFFTTDII